ncbi:hypothetical protein AMK59_1546 [Oryctes borbonicus]|uniref:PDZ domain-containing protein n=1 Tax=Oryctes borbonicus TaxID=1629725 RepID=A0A0T6BF72_9SCAR|nr:hypothetical protein AMK59_1546 [Oryctes borbonicus]
MNWLNCFACKQKTVENVRTLDFSRTSLTEVPADVFNFERTLETLHIDGNKIIELPRTLFQCEELRYLDVSDNEIHTIPTLISKLINLQTLNISRNLLKYTDIPNSIHRCQKLTVLDLSSNILDKVPEGLSSLINLQELYLNDTYIEFLPASFGRLSNLTILELRDNNLISLPKSLRRLTSLVRLDLSNNDFSEMPEMIGNMQNLKELWINGNCISAISINIGNLHNLIDFDASKNDIEIIPKEIGRCTKLTSLILSHNLLNSIPSVIGNLKQLQTLKLDYNCLESLPYKIGDLSNLEEFDVQSNQLTTLPSSIGFLRKLNYFIASHNFLASLPSEISSCMSLTILNLHNNMLKKLPEEIGHLQNLTSLGVIGNKLEYLPIPIASLPHLRALWLTQNQSHPLIPLQTEKLESTGQMVLTCFLLPQIQHVQEDKISPTQNITVPKRHIAFTEPGIPKEPPVRLTRAPTPYPKDFQRFQRSLNNQWRKSRDGSSSGSNVSSDPNIAHTKDAKLTPVKDQIDNIDDLYIKNTMYGTCNNMQPRIVQTNDNHSIRKNPIDLEKQYTYVNNSDNNLDNYCSNYNDKISIDSSDQSKVSLELQESCAIIQGPKEPPPYHIAAAYSKNAKFFNRIDDPLEKNSPIEKPKNFTKELPQNISMPQPVHISKQKGEIDEHFLKELNKRLLNTSDQKNERKLINENRNDDTLSDNFYKTTNYRCVGINCDYSETNSNEIPNTHRVPKLIRVTLNPCCYVLGFTVTYNENGVFVNKVDENGNAFQKLFPGDKILMLDKQDLTKMEPWQAYKTVLMQGPETESFFISRF